MKISLCMIVKDEEKVLGRCLQSVQDIVDQIIIVDTGSIDKTKDIAKEYNAEIYEFQWVDDFSKARNYAFSKAKEDFILWLDADDVIMETDGRKLQHLKENLDANVDAVSMNYVLTEDEEGKPLYSLKRNRLIKTNRNFQWIGFVHEYLQVYGNIFHSDINVIHKKEQHYSDRNLKMYEKFLKSGGKFTSREMFYYANELFDNQHYDAAISQYINFLQESDCWIEDIKNACFKLAEAYKFLGDKENEIKYIFKSFEYDVPRADFCCKLGDMLLDENKIDASIFWFERALSLEPKEDNMGLVNHIMFTYYPWIKLCICYYKKGDIEKAIYCNEMASSYRPNDYYVIYNKEFFNKNPI